MSAQNHMTQLLQIDAVSVRQWLEQNKAVLIDIREPDEYVREHIAGSRLVPLSAFDKADFANEKNKIAVFHCASGNRTANAAQKILAHGFAQVYQLSGGMAAWKAAGLPTFINRKAPISIMRQVQLVAGVMVVLGALLSLVHTPWWALLSFVAGVGLLHAGVSGSCLLAGLLSRLPYNRLPQASS